MLLEGSRDSVARRMNHRSVDVTLPLTIRLLTIRATRARFITLRELLSEPVLLRSCTVALFHWYRCRWCHPKPASSYIVQVPLPPPSYYSTTALFLTLLTQLLLQTFATFRLLCLDYSYQSYLLLATLHTSHSTTLAFTIVLSLQAGRNDSYTNS